MYRWLIGRRQGAYAYHLVDVVFEQGMPIVVTSIEPNDYRRARFEADRKSFIKLHSTGHMELLLHHKTRTTCKRCGGLTYRKEALKGTECTGCSLLLPIRSGSAKQLDRPRV